VRIGVLAVQGAFQEHLDVLRGLGVDAVAVRLPSDLEGVSGLILPGGESTTMRKLIDRWGLHEPIAQLAREGAPIFGTCAGMILLASEITDGDAPVFPLLDQRSRAGRSPRPRSFHSRADRRASRAGRRRAGAVGRRPRGGRAVGFGRRNRLSS
jgi:pyridoxal 5'-phosphate synthase glutaminase subunit Pdx2